MERDDPIAGLRRALAVSRPDADFGLLRRAYEVAAECHDGQLRKSGDPYISHPVMVATILAGLGADDLTLCAALLHSTVRYTPFTLTGLRRKFGSKIGAMVAGHWTLDQISGRPMVRARDVVAAIGSADGPVAALSMADLLHNMRTVEFHPAPKQLRKARDALDIYAPAAQRLSMNALGTELRNLAFGTLVRSQPARPPTRRIIMALDIERSTSRLDPVKGELRIMLYELFDAALRTADIYPDDRDPFEDRGDGLLALIYPDGRIPLTQVAATLAQLLTSYNAGAGTKRQLRVRMVVHEGVVNYDGHGCFGEALDTAFRLLDAPESKQALASAPGPLLLVASGDVGPGGQRITVDVGGRQRSGWLFLPV